MSTDGDFPYWQVYWREAQEGEDRSPERIGEVWQQRQRTLICLSAAADAESELIGVVSSRLRDDDSVRRKVSKLGVRGLVEWAYALEAIDDSVRDDLVTIVNIRNYLAHGQSRRFSDARVSSLVVGLNHVSGLDLRTEGGALIKVNGAFQPLDAKHGVKGDDGYWQTYLRTVQNILSHLYAVRNDLPRAPRFRYRSEREAEERRSDDGS